MLWNRESRESGTFDLECALGGLSTTVTWKDGRADRVSGGGSRKPPGQTRTKLLALGGTFRRDDSAMILIS